MPQSEQSVVEQVSSPRPKQDPEAISLGDESALSWYFGQGLSIYDKSTFGAVLQRITLDGFSSSPCETCNGEGILDDGGFAISTRCLRCHGTGKPAERRAGESERACADCRGSGVVEPYEVKADHGGWCDSCRGSGCTAIARRATRRERCSVCSGSKLAPGSEATVARIERGVPVTVGQTQCPECQGEGAKLATAIPVTKADNGGGVLPDDSALTRFAITSRRLSSVKSRSPALYSALECYYGDVGSRWGREDFGRLFALYALTPSGKKLARWSEPKADGKPDAKASPTAKKPARAKWKNPTPTPGAIPFVKTLSDMFHAFDDDVEYARKHGKLQKIGDFIGPRFENGTLYRKDPMLMRRSTAEEVAADEIPADDLTPQQRIWSQVAAEKRQPKRERTVLLMAAHKQATELLARALKAWENAATRRPDKALKRLAKMAIKRGHTNLGTHMAVQAAGQ